MSPILRSSLRKKRTQIKITVDSVKKLTPHLIESININELQQREFLAILDLMPIQYKNIVNNNSTNAIKSRCKRKDKLNNTDSDISSKRRCIDGKHIIHLGYFNISIS